MARRLQTYACKNQPQLNTDQSAHLAHTVAGQRSNTCLQGLYFLVQPVMAAWMKAVVNLPPGHVGSIGL